MDFAAVGHRAWTIAKHPVTLGTGSAVVATAGAVTAAWADGEHGRRVTSDDMWQKTGEHGWSNMIGALEDLRIGGFATAALGGLGLLAAGMSRGRIKPAAHATAGVAAHGALVAAGTTAYLGTKVQDGRVEDFRIFIEQGRCEDFVLA